jgi:hypothetical protein
MAFKVFTTSSGEAWCTEISVTSVGRGVVRVLARLATVALWMSRRRPVPDP